MTERTRSTPLVVVGVDGSSQSKAVLEWAVEHAQALDGKLRVVLAWTAPELFDLEPARVEYELAAAAERVLADLTADVRRGASAETIVDEGSAVRVLLRESRDADLLVVGRHGHDHAGGKPMGSVTQALVMRAPCPVVVVPV